MDIRCRSDRRKIHTADVNAHFTVSVFCADFEHAWQSEAVQRYSELMEEGKMLMSGLGRREDASPARLLASCSAPDPNRGNPPPSATLRSASLNKIYIQHHSSW